MGFYIPHKGYNYSIFRSFILSFVCSFVSGLACLLVCLFACLCVCVPPPFFGLLFVGENVVVFANVILVDDFVSATLFTGETGHNSEEEDKNAKSSTAPCRQSHLPQ